MWEKLLVLAVPVPETGIIMREHNVMMEMPALSTNGLDSDPGSTNLQLHDLDQVT